MKKLFITGIGTGVGKTVTSAIITEALQADYWKPIQTGSVEGTDSNTVKSLLSNKRTVIHPEAYCLSLPASPHAAAAEEGMVIRIKDIKLPDTSSTLVIEGAGGLMVPLNEKELIIDLIEELDAAVIVVIRHYLGSINHSLLSLQALQQRKIKVEGIIYNGAPNEQSEKAIASFYDYRVIGRIGEEKAFFPSVVSHYAKKIGEQLTMGGTVNKKL